MTEIFDFPPELDQLRDAIFDTYAAFAKRREAEPPLWPELDPENRAGRHRRDSELAPTLGVFRD